MTKLYNIKALNRQNISYINVPSYVNVPIITIEWVIIIILNKTKLRLLPERKNMQTFIINRTLKVCVLHEAIIVYNHVVDYNGL